MLLLDLVTLLCIGLMVGTELAVSCFINPVILQLNEAAQAEALRRFAKLLGRVMPIWYGVNLVLMIGERYLRRHATDLWLFLVAVVLWIAIIVFTIAVLVPINNRVAAMKGPMPEALRREHRRWDTLHRWRVVLLTVAMFCLMLGILRAG